MEVTTIRVGVAILGADDVRRGVELTHARGLVVDVRPASNLTPRESARVMAPGFVNAHVHLDLGALESRVPAGGEFVDWVGRLLAVRDELATTELETGARHSAEAALASGTTSVIDIDSCSVVPGALVASPLRRLSLVELIDGSPAGFPDRSQAAFVAAREALERGDDAAGRVAHGWSPHGTHTVGDELLARLGALRAEVLGGVHVGGPDSAPGGSSRSLARVPVSIHWAETREEVRWLREGTGPFAAWLGRSPQVSGIDRLERAGLLDRALLAHGNFPDAGDPHRIAAAGAAVVHCPGSHRFFGRGPFPLGAYDDAGAQVVLGTDSIASNRALDMRREMRLAVETLGIDVARALRMATEWPARFLPWSHVTGKLEPGSAADLVVFESDGSPMPAANSHAKSAFEGAALEWLVLGEPVVAEVWIDGICVHR